MIGDFHLVPLLVLEARLTRMVGYLVRTGFKAE